MVTPNGVMRVTVALDPEDVELLDRMATLEGSNRSAELRQIMAALRPQMRGVINAMEAALKARDELTIAAAQASASELAELMPELARIQNVMLGAMARLEGVAAARNAQGEPEPPSSNHGGYTPLPDPPEEH